MYLIIKALHLISLVAWFAGLFYIYRLFVYHVAHRASLETTSVFCVMEAKLLKFIMLPSAVLTILFGAAMLWLNPGLLRGGWIWMKLGLVLLLLAYHGSAIYTSACFAQRRWIWTERQCRLINEVPTVLLIGIIFLAVLKPF